MNGLQTEYYLLPERLYDTSKVSLLSSFFLIKEKKKKKLKGHLTYFDKVTHNYPLVLYLSKPLCIDMQGPCNSSLMSHLGAGNNASGTSPRSFTARMHLAIAILIKHLDS